MSAWVKICGVTRLSDAELAREAGADAIGLNFVPSSPRRLDRNSARRIRDLSAGRIEVVLVVADLPRGELEQLCEELSPDRVQLHGSEPPEFVEAFSPMAYKAIHVGEAADVACADTYGGDRVLVDAKVSGKLGGTGVAFDYSLVVALASRRKLILAGGLTAENVQAAIAQVKPFGVDVASGVEPSGRPGVKDPEKLRAFVRAAKGG